MGPFLVLRHHGRPVAVSDSGQDLSALQLRSGRPEDWWGLAGGAGWDERWTGSSAGHAYRGRIGRRTPGVGALLPSPPRAPASRCGRNSSIGRWGTRPDVYPTGMKPPWNGP